jgi:N-acetylmuramoyl-L-alanine amidase
MAKLLAGAAVACLLTAFAISLQACADKPPAKAAEQRTPQPTVLIAIALTPVPSPSPVPAGPMPPSAPLAGWRVCIDPGHDARWVPGASGRTSGGTVPRHPTEGVPLFEHELTLSVAYRLKTLLEADGAEVCVTRRPRDLGGGLQIEPYDYTGDGRVRPAGVIEDVPEQIQPRIDWANLFGAQVLVSIHFNGLEDQRVRGTEVYYTDGGPRRDEGRRLASALLTAMLEGLRSAGHPAVDRGIRSDAYQRYPPEETRRMIANNSAIIRANGSNPADCPECYRLMTMGNNPMSLHRGGYVAAMIEVEFLSNPAVVEGLILRPDSFDLIAGAIHAGLRAFYARE